ncbi:hypothetical protein NDU88_001716 [Pleurodeles waltl]|uniref:Uncharacterized protein n=1 Tax=Pleurodeles waltl TaxID=8319 RepID=A0AAV7U995_PLEWA|nr:hypothetical protein NDU88_001716 [Pleurodeles waltl]
MLPQQQGVCFSVATATLQIGDERRDRLLLCSCQTTGQQHVARADTGRNRSKRSTSVEDRGSPLVWSNWRSGDKRTGGGAAGRTETGLADPRTPKPNAAERMPPMETFPLNRDSTLALVLLAAPEERVPSRAEAEEERESAIRVGTSPDINKLAMDLDTEQSTLEEEDGPTVTPQTADDLI